MKQNKKMRRNERKIVNESKHKTVDDSWLLKYADNYVQCL